MRFSVLRKMMPKSQGAIYMEDKITPMDRRGGGRTKYRKIYRHKFFVGLKKVVTGQSQNAKKSCFKSSTQNAKRTFLDMLPFVAYLSNIFRKRTYDRCLYKM